VSENSVGAARWDVELTDAAVEVLWALPADERRRVAARIDHLADTGLPPHLREAGAAVELGAGGQRMLCVEDPERKRIVIVTIHAADAAMAPSLLRWARRAIPDWMTDWMGGEEMGSTVQDLKFALRSLRRSPGFTVAALLTLALGIGATTAIFSVANGVLLRPLPYADADEIVTVWASWDNFPDKTWLSVPEYQLFHQENRTLEDLALYGTGAANFTTADSPERVGAATVTPNTFELLGVAPVVGRVFDWEEAQESNPGVLLAWDTWMRRYGGDASIVGRTVELDGELTPVLGVLPEGFVLPVDFSSTSVAEVFTPLYVDLESPAPDLGGGGSHGYYGVGRARDGVMPEEVHADFERMMGLVEPVGLYSAERRFTPRVYAAKADIVGSARATILVLLGAVGFVLLIACGNVANLMLSRSEARTGEVAVRTVLGAGKGRILRQLLTESLVLALGAGALGFALAWVGVDALLAIDPNAVPRSASVSLDASVALFTLGITIVTALLFGVAPAVRVARSGLGARLREGGRGDRRGAGANRLQGLLVASQMAMAVILLTGSGLMMKSFIGLVRIDTGFDAGDVLTMRITASAARYPDGDAVVQFYDEALRQISQVPGVRSASAVRLLPLGSTMGDSGFRPVGYQPGPNESTQGDWQWATPGYFETMGIPLVEGRTFEEADRRDGQRVVVVNETIARRYWGTESPLGRAVLAGGGDTAIVVGVVGDIRHNGITEEVKTRFYRPHAQIGGPGYEGWEGTMRSMTLTIGTEGDPRRLIEPIRTELRALDPSMPVSQVHTMDEVLAASVAQPRFAMVLLAAFAALALMLAVVGIYGVLAYAVSQRTREIGIRMALGAETGRVVSMVVRQGLGMAVAGVAVGTAFAWFMTDLMSGMLYGVAPQDPLTFVSVPLLFVAVALAACWLPAMRATRVRPVTALKYE
jgi:putative ABC transport system permease protein